MAPHRSSVSIARNEDVILRDKRQTRGKARKCARKQETARAAFPCIDVGRSEEPEVAGSGFTAAKSDLVARGRRTRTRTRTGREREWTNTECENAKRILDLMLISFLDKRKGITCTALYLLESTDE